MATRHLGSSEQNRQIGLWLRERRVAHGLTQQELAELLGVTYQQLHKYEKGINRLSLVAAFTVAESLGGLDELRRIATAEAEMPAPVTVALRSTRRIVELVGLMPERGRVALRGLLESWAEGGWTP